MTTIPQVSNQLTILPRALSWLALSLGLLTFTIGSALNSLITPALASKLLLGTMVLMLALTILTRLPCIKSLAGQVRQLSLWAALKWLFTPLYAGLLGLCLPAIPMLWFWVGGIFVAALAVFLFAHLTRPVWQSFAAALPHGQKWLGILALIGFVLLLVALWCQASIAIITGLLIFQVVVLTLTFILGCTQLAAVTNGHPMDRVTPVLFSGIGLLILVGVRLLALSGG